MNKQDKFPMIYYFLVLIQAFLSMSFYMVTPLITTYLTDIGSTLALAGMLSGILSYVCLVLRPFSGALADRVNPKCVLAISMGLFGISIIGYGMSESIVVFAFCRIVSGISFSFASTTMFAYAGFYIPQKRMGEGIGYLGMGNILASAIGPMLGSILSPKIGFGMLFAAAGMLSLIPAICLIFIQKSGITPKERKREKHSFFRLKNIFAVELVYISLLAALFGYANSTMSNFLLLYAKEKGIAQASLYFSCLAIFLVILRPLTGKINDKFGLKYVLIPGYLCTILGVLMISKAEHLLLLLAASSFMAFGQGGGQPAVQAECMRRLGKERRGVATSTYYIFNDIAQALAPTIGGILAGSFGYTIIFRICIGLFVIGLLSYLFSCRRSSHP